MKTTASEKKKPFIIALMTVGIVLAGLLFCYFQFRPQPEQGEKEISIEVVYEDQSSENSTIKTSESYTIRTNAEYLEQALEDAKGLTIEGSRTKQFGLMIESVNGVEAVYDKNQAYWAIEVDGKPCNYGVSQQPVRNGEHYRLVYTAASMP